MTEQLKACPSADARKLLAAELHPLQRDRILTGGDSTLNSTYRAALRAIDKALTRPSPEADALRTQVIAQVLWEKIGPAITAPRAADIARDISAALEGLNQ